MFTSFKANKWRSNKMCSLFDTEKTFTYEDYCNWNKFRNFELINGKASEIEFIPKSLRQKTVLNMANKISATIEGKGLYMYMQPIDVKLSDSTIVKPDLALISDISLFNGDIYAGIPDALIELFPENDMSDSFLLKYQVYASFGIKEFWSVDPFRCLLDIHILQSDGYLGESFVNEIVPLSILEGTFIDFSDVLINVED
jgi:Uma2 family endonuclease